MRLHRHPLQPQAFEEGVRKIYVFVMALLPLISLYNCVTNVLAL